MKAFLPLLLAASLAQASPFTKLDGQGRPMPVTAGPWVCVHDARTGLVWENKTDNEGPRFVAATPSWFDGKRGTPRSGSCAAPTMSYSSCDLAMQVEVARSARWCGRANWRVPTGQELATLLFDTGFAGDARIQPAYFPHTGRYPYWSADLRTGNDGQPEARVLHFGDGHDQWLETSQGARVRLVSGPSGSMALR
ncbi:DUF1566 domain-containing protein [Chitinibacteraceae bacterium HSL-7]